MPFLGAHESVSGGLHTAFARIEAVGGECLQIFTRNQRQWRHKPLVDEEIDLFRRERDRRPAMMVVSHGSYLINLAAGSPATRNKSIDALVAELRRCHVLGLPYLILHPGSHGGDGVDEGIARVAAALDEAINRAEADTMVLIENTAGQGTGLGRRFEELAMIREQAATAASIGVCFDTCHVFAAGYDIRGEQSYNRTMAEFDRIVGCEHLRFFHLNDSKKELGSRVDRHEHIGHGALGLEGFAPLLNDPRFASHAMAIETPKGEELREDRENLARLRGLLHP